MAYVSGDAIRDFDLNLFQQPPGYVQLQQKYCKLKSQLTYTKKKILYTSHLIENFGQAKLDLEAKEKEVFALKEECMKACISYKAESEKLANIEKENENLRMQCSTAEEENKKAQANFIQSESKNEALYSHIKQLQHLLNEREEKIASMKIELSLSSSSLADMKQKMCKYVRAINRGKMSNKQIMEIFDNFVEAKDLQSNMDEATSNEVHPKKLNTNVILQLENTLSILDRDAKTENFDNIVKLLCKSKRNKQICLKLLCLLRDISDKFQDHDSDVYSDVNSEDFDSCSLDIEMDNVRNIDKNVDVIAINAKHKPRNSILFDRNEICGEAYDEGSHFDAPFGTPTYSIDTGCGSSLTSTKNFSPDYVTNSPSSTDSGLFKSLSKAASVATSPASEFLVDKSTNTNWLPVDQSTNTSIIVCHKSTSIDNLTINKIKCSDKASNTNGSRCSDKAINTDETRLTTSYVSNLEVEDILDTMTLRFNMLSPLPLAPPELIETSTQTQMSELNKDIVKYSSCELRAEEAHDMITDPINVFFEDTHVSDNDKVNAEHSLNMDEDVAHNQNDHLVPADHAICNGNSIESISIVTELTREQQSELHDGAETNITLLQDINTPISPKSNILNVMSLDDDNCNQRHSNKSATKVTHTIKDSDVRLRKTSPKINKQKQRKSMVSKARIKMCSSLSINFLQDLPLSDDDTDNQEPLKLNEDNSNIFQREIAKCSETNIKKTKPKMTKLQRLQKSIKQIRQGSLSSSNLLQELMSENDTNIQDHLKHNKGGNGQSKNNEDKEPHDNVISQSEITISNDISLRSVLRSDDTTDTLEHSELSNSKVIMGTAPLTEVAMYNSSNIEAVLQDQILNSCKKSKINNSDDNSDELQKETVIVTEDQEYTVKENNNIDTSPTLKTKCTDSYINPAPNNCETLRKEKISSLKHSEPKNTVNNYKIKESNIAQTEVTKDIVANIPTRKTITQNDSKINNSENANKNEHSETVQNKMTQFSIDVINSVSTSSAIPGQQSKSLENGKLNQSQINNCENNECIDSSFKSNSLDTIEERPINTRRSTKKKITKLQKIKKALVPKSKIRDYSPLPRKVCLNQLKSSGVVAQPIETNCTALQIKENDAYQKALEVVLELRIKQKENCNRKFKSRSSLKPNVNNNSSLTKMNSSFIKLLDNKKELKVSLQRLTETDIADIINSFKNRTINTSRQIKRKRYTSATLEPERKRILRSHNLTQNATLYNTNINVNIEQTTSTRNKSKIQEEEQQYNENEIRRKVTRLSQSHISNENIINESHNNINTAASDAISGTRKLRQRPKLLSFTSEDSDSLMSPCRRSLRNKKTSKEKIKFKNIHKPEISNKRTYVLSKIGHNDLDLFGDGTPLIITSSLNSKVSSERPLSTIVTKHNNNVSRNSIKSHRQETKSVPSVDSDNTMSLCRRSLRNNKSSEDKITLNNLSKPETSNKRTPVRSKIGYNDLDLFGDGIPLIITSSQNSEVSPDRPLSTIVSKHNNNDSRNSIESHRQGNQSMSSVDIDNNTISLCRRSLRNSKSSEDKINLNNISKPETSNKRTRVRSEIGYNDLDLFGDRTPKIITLSQNSEISPERPLSTAVTKHNNNKSHRQGTQSMSSVDSDNSMSLCRRSLRNNKSSEDKMNFKNVSKPEISNKRTHMRSEIGYNDLDLFCNSTPVTITCQNSEVLTEKPLSTIVPKPNNGSRDSIKCSRQSLSSVDSECSMIHSSNSFEANNNSLMVTKDQESPCKRFNVVQRQDSKNAGILSKEENIHPTEEQSSKPNIVTYNDLDLFSNKSKFQNKERVNTNNVGYFYKMLEQHCGTQKYMKQSKSVTESSVEDLCQMLELQIGSITELPDKDVINAISPLAKYISTVNRKVFLSVIIKYLMSANRDSDIQCRKYTPPAPPMTKQEQVLLYILCHLRKAWSGVDVFGEVLRCIRFTLFRLNHSPDFKQVDSLSHFYAVVCRYTRAQSHLRSFMVDALYCMSFKAIPVIKQCLDVWMHVLPLAHLSMAKDPLVLCIVFLLQFYTCDDKFNRVQPLRQTLVKTYFYNMADWNETKVLMYLKSCLMDIRGVPAEKKNLRMCLIILAKRKGVTWCQKNIVDNMILPIVNDTKADARVQQFCVAIIGPIMRPYPTNMKINCEIAIDRLLIILGQKCTHEMQEAVLSSLIYLSKHNITKVTEALLSWRPQRRVSPELDQLIIDYIRERSPGKWLQVLT